MLKIGMVIAKMRKKRFLSLLVLLALATMLPLSACGAPTGEQPGSSENTEAETEPVTAPPKETEPEDTTDYQTLGRIPFEGLTASPEADFTVEETPGGVTVTAYTGTAERVRIPETIGGRTVTAIGDGAFRGIQTIRVLWIPDSVTTFGNGVLVGASALYALHTPLPAQEGKQFIGWLFGATSYEGNNVQDLRHVDFLEIGGKQSVLPDFALFDCNDLVTVRLSDTITSLGAYSFARCASLKVLDVSGIRQVGEGALLGCSELRSLEFSAALESVGFAALGSCDALRRLTLPFVGESRTEHGFLGWLFGATAAEQSKGLYPNKLSLVTLLSGAPDLAAYAFYAAPVEQVTIGSGTAVIGARAFADCTALRLVELADSVTEIGAAAFSGCTTLKELVLPSSLSTLGVQAFLGCTALCTVTLPETLEQLPNGCFMGCRALETVDLGGVTGVGTNAFRGCAALRTVRSARAVTFAAGNEAAQACLAG